MLLVVDATIICSALVGGKLTDLFLSSKIELVAPDLLFTELKKHIEELKQKSRLTEEDFAILVALLEKRIRVIPLEEFSYLFERAEEILGDHVKDAPYVALALQLQCLFLTYEKRLLKNEEIKTITTEELVKIIYTKF